MLKAKRKGKTLSKIIHIVDVSTNSSIENEIEDKDKSCNKRKSKGKEKRKRKTQGGQSVKPPFIWARSRRPNERGTPIYR